MSEDPTKDLTAVEMLRAVLADVRDMKARLGAVEDGIVTFKVTVDDRLSALESAAEDRARETRPKLDLIVKGLSDLREEMAEVRAEMAEIRADVRSIDRKLEVFNDELLGMKVDLRDFNKRLAALERAPN